MTMNKKSAGNIVIALGGLLFGLAIALAIFNINTDKKGGEYAHDTLVKLKQGLPETKMAVSQTETTPFVPNVFDKYISRDDEMYYEQEKTPLIDIDGSMYVGILSIPSLSIELPVYDTLNYENLKNSPCRYKGTVRDGDMIIAAHNYSSHFGSISEMITDDRILFIDANGEVREYSVIQTERIDGTDVQAMEYGSDEWDITLFTCNLSGKSRVTIRAVMI